MSRNFSGGSGPPNIEGMFSLKVDNLTYRTTMDDLEKYFRKYGEVGDIYIPRDRNTHESRGFAFVRYFEERDAEDAMDSMDGKVIDGREVRVAMAKYGRPANQYDPNRGRRGRRSPPRRRSRSRSYDRSRRSRRSRSRTRSPKKRSESPKRTSRSPAAKESRRRDYSRSRSREN